jgi:hypothetical protein
MHPSLFPFPFRTNRNLQLHYLFNLTTKPPPPPPPPQFRMAAFQATKTLTLILGSQTVNTLKLVLLHHQTMLITRHCLRTLKILNLTQKVITWAVHLLKMVTTGESMVRSKLKPVNSHAVITNVPTRIVQ